MLSRDIRRSFIDFYAGRGHAEVASSPLVPRDDPTLLFVNAGMVQFKNYFLGVEQPDSPRAVTSQKCLRVSGKHNDLENVGPSPRHHTFFEMLGNFSFGDYFKEEAIASAWELVTGPWGLRPEHLFATVFEDDDEAEDLWLRISGLPPERVLRCGEKDNFWAMGETGPCGPCSEIFVDTAPELPEVGFDEGSDSGRYLEIWNLVFMQFERHEDGRSEPLPNPSIDTGAGLERVAAVLQGVDSNYDTDLFGTILTAVAGTAGSEYGRDPEADVSMRVVADHLRAVGFLLADGVLPSNEGRGYVLRRLLRRASRHGVKLGFEEPFLASLLPSLEETFAGHYPELEKAREPSSATVTAEETRFLETVAVGGRQGPAGDRGGARRGRFGAWRRGCVPSLRHVWPADRDGAGDRRGGAVRDRRGGVRGGAGGAAGALANRGQAARPRPEGSARRAAAVGARRRTAINGIGNATWNGSGCRDQVRGLRRPGSERGTLRFAGDPSGEARIREALG